MTADTTQTTAQRAPVKRFVIPRVGFNLERDECGLMHSGRTGEEL